MIAPDDEIAFGIEPLIFGAARLEVRKRRIVRRGLVGGLDHDLHGLLDLTNHFDGVKFPGHGPSLRNG
jgi:hypothetical protein